MEIEENAIKYPINNAKNDKSHTDNNVSRDSTSLNEDGSVNNKDNKDKMDINCEYDEFSNNNHLLPRNKNSESQIINILPKNKNNSNSNEPVPNLNNKSQEEISYKSCLFNDGNDKYTNNLKNNNGTSSPTFRISIKRYSEKNSSKIYNSQMLPKNKSKNNIYKSQIQRDLNEQIDNPNIINSNETYHPSANNTNNIINLEENNNNILHNSNNEINNNPISCNSSHKAKGWLFYYDNLEYDLKWLNSELTDRIGLDYLSHIISAHNDEDIGIYVHMKFFYNIEYDNSIKSRFFDIEYNNKTYKPKIRAVKDWQILSCLCINPDNYCANFNPNKSKIAQSYTNKFLINKNMSSWLESGETKLKDIPRNLTGIQLYKDYITRQKNNQKWNKRRKIWLCGKPGVGKSYVVVNSLNDLYHKSLDESWGDYFGEKNVVVELNEDYTKKIGNLLKLWTEDYIFQVPGNNVYLHPLYSTIVIISYFTIQEYFATNQNLMISMSNRCDVIKMEGFKDEHWISVVLKYGNPYDILDKED